MGREVRRVPPNWPSKVDHPMHDQRFDEAFAEWLQDFDRIRAGNLSDIERECYTSDCPLAEWLLDYGALPDPAYYRPWTDEEATWFQVWETVSEGTPVTPAFSTKEELVDYLVKHGDFWEERGFSRATAEKFVMDTGWAPSAIITSGGRIASGISALDLLQKKEPEE